MLLMINMFSMVMIVIMTMIMCMGIFVVMFASLTMFMLSYHFGLFILLMRMCAFLRMFMWRYFYWR